MKSGPKRHRVILERPVDSQDDGGQVVRAWTAAASGIPAQIEDIAGREFFGAAQIQADITTRIRIRYRDDIEETWRVRHIKRYASPMIEELYDVAAVITDMKTGRKELQLMCTKRRADGWRRDQENTGEFRVDNPDLRVDDPSWRVDSV